MEAAKKQEASDEERAALLQDSSRGDRFAGKSAGRSAASDPRPTRTSKADPEALTQHLGDGGGRQHPLKTAALVAGLLTMGVLAYVAMPAIDGGSAVDEDVSAVNAGEQEELAVETRDQLAPHEISRTPWCDKIAEKDFPVDKCRANCRIHHGTKFLACSEYPQMHNPPVPHFYKEGCKIRGTSSVICQKEEHARTRSNFQFWANDHRIYQFVLRNASARYNEEDRTYTFPACKNHKCFQPYCIGRCGAGCGNEKYEPECELMKFQEIGTFSGSASRINQVRCRHHCLNHDLCSFAHLCPDNVEWLGPAKPAAVGCNKGPIRFAARDYFQNIGPQQDCKPFAADGIVGASGRKEGYRVFYPENPYS